MEATYTETASREFRPSPRRVHGVARTIRTALTEIVAAGIRGDDFNRAFASAPGAQFATFSASSKQRLLDRGFRP